MVSPPAHFKGFSARQGRPSSGLTMELAQLTLTRTGQHVDQGKGKSTSPTLFLRGSCSALRVDRPLIHDVSLWADAVEQESDAHVFVEPVDRALPG